MAFQMMESQRGHAESVREAVCRSRSNQECAGKAGALGVRHRVDVSYIELRLGENLPG